MMKYIIKILFTIIFTIIMINIFVGCVSTIHTPQVPTDTIYCKSGCAHLLTLTGRDGKPGCEEARVIEMPNGEIVTCESFCVEIQNNGKSLCPSGWLDLTNCNQIESSRSHCNLKL